MVEWMVRATLAGALAGLGGLAMERVLCERRLPVRLVWVVSLTMSLALPLLAVAAPSLWLATPLAARLDLPVLIASAPVAGAQGGSATLPAQLNLLFVLWALGSGFLLLRYWWAWRRVRRVLARSRAVSLAETTVWITSGLGPAVVGVIRPRIVIPGWVLGLAEDTKRLVVRHEQEHVRVGDHWLLGLTPLLAVAFPWNAAIWWQLRRLRRAVELDCDARVLRAGAPVQTYATLLLDVADKRAFAAGFLALSQGRSLVQKRVHALLRPARQAQRTRSAGLIALTALVALASLVAMVPDRPVLAQRFPSATAQVKEQADPLFVIDQTPVLPGQLVDVLVDRIVGLEEVDPASAAARFGAQARAGAFVISTTNKSVVTRTMPATRAGYTSRNSIDLTVRLREFNHLAVQSGVLDVRRVAALGLSLGRVGSLLASDVLSIQVVKGDAALLRGYTAARSGAIILVLRSDYFGRRQLAR